MTQKAERREPAMPATLPCCSMLCSLLALDCSESCPCSPLRHTSRYALRCEDANPISHEIVGEILLTTRRFYSSASVCPDRLAFSESDSEDDAEPAGPVDHGTQPMAPIDEPTLAMVAVVHGRR